MPVSLIGLINRLTPKHKGSHKIASGLRYGPTARHRLDIYAPRQQDSPLPIIVYFHGGSWSEGDPESYGFIGRSLAALGYVVVLPAYRLVPDIEYPAFLEDCAAATRFVTENAEAWRGDRHKVALAGHSAGAYNAAMLALVPDLRLAAGLAQNLCGVAVLSGPFDFFPFDGPISLRVFGAVPNPRKTQPVVHVQASAPPFFLATGDRDRLVYPRNTAALAARLKAAGVTVEEHHYPRLEHAFPMLALGRLGRFLAPVRTQLRDFFAKVFA
ncbi:Acetyl esterase/lipase [Devosia crocina]|uniref:Acetyl esterase/lipase n=1 Tax=Devosia crocina TaxID=429728 RepID=A0A1I7MVM0_9HYPH|nr:alpha/beta hydrolase [Devosia crocina]SFV26441.1 Acetyl esterase/lipase [Devosia crocina]